jgi:hypothetical protein
MIRARNCVVHFGRPETEQNIEVTNQSSTGFDVIVDGEDVEPWTVRIDEQEFSSTSTSSLSLDFAVSDNAEVEVDAPFFFSGAAVDAPLPDSYSDTPVSEMCEEFLEEMKALVEYAEDEFEFISNSTSE